MAKKQSYDTKAAVEDIKNDKKLMLLVGGSAALLLGMLLPWVSVDLGEAGSFLGNTLDTTSSGLDVHGFSPIILLVVAVAAALNIFDQNKKYMYIISASASALAFVMVLAEYPRTDGFVAVSVGIGYWFSLLGSAAMTAGAGWLLKDNTDFGKTK